MRSLESIRDIAALFLLPVVAVCYGGVARAVGGGGDFVGGGAAHFFLVVFGGGVVVQVVGIWILRGWDGKGL